MIGCKECSSKIFKKGLRRDFKTMEGGRRCAGDESVCCRESWLVSRRIEGW